MPDSDGKMSPGIRLLAELTNQLDEERRVLHMKLERTLHELKHLDDNFWARVHEVITQVQQEGKDERSEDRSGN